MHMSNLPGYPTEVYAQRNMTFGGATATSRGSSHKGIDSEEQATPRRASHFRSVVGKRHWMVPLRPDIAYTAKELSRPLQAPTEGDFAKLKHLLKHLRGTRDYRFSPPQVPSYIWSYEGPSRLCRLWLGKWQVYEEVHFKRHYRLPGDGDLLLLSGRPFWKYLQQKQNYPR